MRQGTRNTHIHLQSDHTHTVGPGRLSLSPHSGNGSIGDATARCQQAVCLFLASCAGFRAVIRQRPMHISWAGDVNEPQPHMKQHCAREGEGVGQRNSCLSTGPKQPSSGGGWPHRLGSFIPLLTASRRTGNLGNDN